MDGPVTRCEYKSGDDNDNENENDKREAGNCACDDHVMMMT